MGFYIRKALRVGPFRFNLSRSGVGVSAGIKGLRIGAGPRGNYIHMGRGGLYFRKTLGPAGAGAPPVSSPAVLPPAPVSETAEALQEIESGATAQMVDASAAELLGELNEKRQKTRLFPYALAAAAILLTLLVANRAPVWALALVAALVAASLILIHQKDELRKTTVVLYELDDSIAARYQRLHDEFSALCSCSRIWHIEARGAVKDRKYHAGAGAVVKRHVTSPSTGMPPFVKTNVTVPLIPVGRQLLALMPERLLVFEAAAVGAVSYADLRLDLAAVDFVEDESLPSDATVVGRTWRYVNKKGGPDRRFANNPEIPVCRYGQIHFSSATGLNEVLQFSRENVTEAFAEATRALGQPA